jgi:UDP-2,3-diacylglucosamine hydrolase
VDFISDLHLHAAEPDTHVLWQQYMECTRADAVFILGDLFEVWVGDDVLDDSSTFEAYCATVIRQTSARAAVYLMHGNRDFLMSKQLASACNAELLADPTVLQLAHERVLLTHGDAFCLGDTAYQAFRQTVRTVTWQQDFLSKPLMERQVIAAGIRAHSEAQKSEHTTYADVDTFAAANVLKESTANTMVHGHTHRPATHALPDGKQRWVLSDWHVHGNDSRAEVLRLTRPILGQQATYTRLHPSDAG